MATKLTHKVRNPKDLSQWLELWTAEIITTDDPNNPIDYTINPSKKWNINIPITNVTVESGENIVTSKSPFYEKATDFNPDTIYYILDNTGEYKEANPKPTVDNFNPDIYYIQNNEGLAYIDQNKITKVIKADRGLSIQNNTIGHSNTITSEPISYSSSGSSVTIPTIQYDDYGHIKNVGTQTHTINNLNIDSLNKNEFSPNTAHEGEPSNAKTFNNTIIDIIKDNTSKLTFNSADKDGIVKAVKEKNEQGQVTNYHANEVWASGNKIDSNNNTPEPTWRKITNNMISDDEDEKISGSKITEVSTSSAGVVPAPPSEEKNNRIWGTDNNGDLNWVSLKLSSEKLNISYSEELSKLYVGIDSQGWVADPNSTSEQLNQEYWIYYPISYTDYLKNPSKEIFKITGENTWEKQTLGTSILTKEEFNNLGLVYHQTHVEKWSHIIDGVSSTLSSNSE